MGRRRDLDLSELNTGTIRRKRREETKCRDREAEKERSCLHCGKLAYPNEGAVRAKITALLGARYTFDSTDTYALRPYICPHGWWHLGRNRKAISLIRGRKKQLTEQQTIAPAA